ncbi:MULTISPECIES: hypothetical protein [Cobetia]|uniref:hypothetical protein n=1 Tax=Cobetia TaxID=204286 RepID=UPI001581CC55|nr:MULTISPECIES: hypothetical protein [Cobetia]MDI4661827.1 hypothetical protein [Cobetia sp. BMC6]MDL2191577.1 hypothetical protein [Cobetia sp. LC6]NUJ56527.1 hypothetical protein [Cobetia marina]
MALRILQRHGRKTRSRAGFFVPVVQAALKRAATTTADSRCPCEDVTPALRLLKGKIVSDLALFLLCLCIKRAGMVGCVGERSKIEDLARIVASTRVEIDTKSCQ